MNTTIRNMLKKVCISDLLLLLLIVTFTLQACQTNNTNSLADNTPTPPITSDYGSIDENVEAIISSIDPAQPDTLYAPEELIALGHDAVPALLKLLDSPDVITRWAAVYALTRLAQTEDIPGLVKGLDDPNLSNRAGIAATLLWLGDDRGLSILEEALLSDELMIFSHPPERVSDYARKVLEELNPESLSDSQTYKTHVLAGPAKSPPNDVGVTRSGCKVEITVNLQFSGSGASEALANKWKRSIMDMWDGKASSYCCETALTVNTKVGGATDSDYAQITVIQVPPGGYHTSSNSLGGTVADGASNDVTGTWDSNDSGAAAAHETGHAMGVPNEYALNADGYAEPTGDAVGESDGEGIPGIMAQTWADAEGQTPEAKPRHIDAILNFYDVQCVCCGLVEWDINSPVFSLFVRIFTCDGTNWHGEFSEELQIQGASAQTTAEFDLIVPEGANVGEAEFVAEGIWIVGGETIPFQDNLVLRLHFEKGPIASMGMNSLGGVLYIDGQTVPVPQAVPGAPIEGNEKLPILPYISCRLE